MFQALGFGNSNKNDLNYQNRPEGSNPNSHVSSHSSPGVMSEGADTDQPLNMSLNPSLPPRPGEPQGSGQAGPGGPGRDQTRGAQPVQSNQSMFNLQQMWDILSDEDKKVFIDQNHIPTVPPAPLSYEAELRSEQSDLEEDMALLEEEIQEIDDQITVNHDEFNLLAEQKDMSKRRTALIGEKRKAIEKARARNKNALDLETQRRFRELRRGKMKDTAEDELRDLVGSLVRKEVAKLALNSKAAKMREETEEETRRTSIPGPNQTVYADLLRNHRTPNLIDFKSQSEEDDPGGQDDFPSLTGARRKKKGVRISEPDHVQDDLDTQSLVSVGTSLFDSNPVSALLFKLKKRHKSAKKAMRDYPDQIKVLELEKDGITRLLQSYEISVSKLENVGPAERDELTTSADQLEEDQLQLVLLLSKIHKSIEDKKNNPRPVFPKFTGTYTDFNNFQKEIDAAMMHLEDSQKKTVYKNAAIQGINKEEIMMLLANCDSYQDMKSQMYSKFGHFDSVLPAQLDIIRDLPETPGSIAQENTNIGVILSFLRWLQSHDRTSIFTSANMVTCRKKLRSFSQDLYSPGQCKTFNEFKVYLEGLQGKNFERLNGGQVGQGHGGGGGQSGGQGGKNKPHNTRTNAAFSRPEGKVRSCWICGGSHFASLKSCPSLLGAQTVEAVKDILAKKKVCFVCLQAYSATHKNECKTEAFDKAKNKYVSKVCGLCASNLNKYVCPCKSGSPHKAQYSPAVPQPGGGVHPPPVTPSSLQPAKPQAGTGSRSNVTSVYNSRIELNGAVLGRSQCCVQMIRLLSPNNDILEILGLWDTGCETTVCSKELCNYFWKSSQVTYTFSQCTSSETVVGAVADLQILTNDNQIHSIQALAQDLNSQVIDAKVFDIPSNWQQSHRLPEQVLTAGGAYMIIFGRDLNKIFPVEIDRHENLSLYKSAFDDELIVAGSDAKCPLTGPRAPVSGCHSARFSPADTEWLNMVAPPDFSILPKVCPKCKNNKCSDCKNQLLLSPQTRYEEEVLTQCLKFISDPKPDGSLGYWQVHGKYNSQLPKVPTLFEQTKTFQLKLERKLGQNKAICDEFNAAIFKRIKSGNFSLIKDVRAECSDFDTFQKVYSPCNYSLKLSSESTKCRPCVNSSFSPEAGSPSLNQAMFVGSSLNLPIQKITLKLREYREFAVNDVSNYYQSLKLSYPDRALNLMIFRENGWCEEGDLVTLVSNCLMYGQSFSQFLANKAKNLTSEQYILPISEKAHLMILASLTDDIYCGAFTKKERAKLMSIIEDGLKKASFFLKGWSMSGTGDSDSEVIIGSPAPASQSCLGLTYFSKEDYFLVPANLNISPKKRGAKDKGFEIDSLEKARELFSVYGVSKRQYLRLTMGTYDPLNFFIQLKMNKFLLYRKLIRMYPNCDWDQVLPEDLHNDWLKVIQMTLQCSQIKIPRFCMKNCVDQTATCGIFVDGSCFGSSTRIFIRYLNAEGNYECNYVFGSPKLAQPGSESAPHTECEAALMGLRLAVTLTECFSEINFEAYHLFSDSLITLGGLCGLTCTQKLFYSSRNFASQQIISDLNVKLYYTQSCNQDGDIGSKLELDRNHALEDSYWTSLWYYKTEDLWPVTPYKFDVNDADILQNPKLKINVNAASFSISVVASLLSKFNSFKKIVTTLAYIFLFLKSVPTFLLSWGKAQQFILKMLKVSKDEISGVQRQFIVKLDEQTGLYMVYPRNYMCSGKVISNKLILISKNEKVAEKILFDCHIHCSAVGAELGKMYSEGYFVTGARAYFKKLQVKCIACRRIRKAASQALMGPSYQLQTAINTAPFSVISMDCLGYFKLKISKNIRGKLYVLCLTCLFTRYTLFIALESMHATSVLMAIRQAAYQLSASTPSVIFCDSASNFLPINYLEHENKAPEKTTNLTDLRKLLHSQKITLKSSSPRASWRNSMSESLVRIFKMSLKKSGLDNKSFTLQQWNFVLAKISFLSNARVINVKYMNEQMVPLTPSHLVFGSRRDIFPRDIELSDDDHSLFSSLIKLDKQIKAYENIYMSSYAIELLKWTKFKTQGRGLKENDVVFMLDKINKSTKQHQLGTIIKKLTDRTFRVEYLKKEAKIDPSTFEITRVAKKTDVLRPAQQLCYITTADCRDEVNVDPHTPPTDIEECDLIVPHQGEPDEGVLAEDDDDNDEGVGGNVDTPLDGQDHQEEPGESNVGVLDQNEKDHEASESAPGNADIVDINDDDSDPDVASPGNIEVAKPRQRLQVQVPDDVQEMVDIVKLVPVRDASKRPRGRPKKK